MTVVEWVDVWASQYLGGVKESTVAAYNATIRTHIKPGLGAIRLDALDTHLVQSFYNSLREPTKDRAASFTQDGEKRSWNPSQSLTAGSCQWLHTVQSHEFLHPAAR